MRGSGPGVGSEHGRPIHSDARVDLAQRTQRGRVSRVDRAFQIRVDVALVNECTTESFRLHQIRAACENTELGSRRVSGLPHILAKVPLMHFTLERCVLILLLSPTPAFAQTTLLASMNGGGVPGNGSGEQLSISPDGSCEMFTSPSTNLVANDVGAFNDAYVRDISTSVTELGTRLRLN